MKIITKTLVLILMLTVQFSMVCQGQKHFKYEASAAHPFGLPNPNMPPELMDFSQLIGECHCQSISRIDQNTWADTVAMTWRFKYIMNGMAVQDETLKEDGKHSGSIRQFIPDSTRWFVHYYSSNQPSTILSAWEGGKVDNGNIILYRDQKAPNGMEGNYKITFSEITDKGFNWFGEWVTKDESFSYPNWKIYCTKKSYQSNEKEKEKILKNIESFSKAYVNADYDFIANAYTPNGKIFPNNTDIIEGRAAIKEKWTIKNGSKILSHKISPKEITFSGDYAYDFGYYQGESQSKDGVVSPFKGKYVIVWKKSDGDWKMYLDIWNRIQ